MRMGHATFCHSAQNLQAAWPLFGLLSVSIQHIAYSTTISGNTLHNEYYGIQIVNGEQTFVEGNKIDATVQMPVKGTVAPIGMGATTTMAQAATVAPPDQTGIILGSICIVIAVVAGPVAVTALRRKSSKAG
jgi:parallel beta-helix repeat protein